MYRRLLDAVATVPGVSAVAMGSNTPFATPPTAAASVFVEGMGNDPQTPTASAHVQSVSAGYFDALRIPTIAGRVFRLDDDHTAPRVATINRAMARLVWPNADPIGARVRTGVDAGTVYTIVGIVDDVKQNSLDGASAPAVYLPVTQWTTRSQTLVVRTQIASDALLPALRAAAASVDPAEPLYDIAEVDALVERSLSVPSMASRILTALAMLTVVLAAIGAYAVVAYSAGLRRGEFGIRLALGARPSGVLALVLRDAASLAASGVGLGLVGAFVASRIAARHLFGVSATDPAIYALAASFLAAVTVCATLAPARRAARIDPAEALKNG